MRYAGPATLSAADCSCPVWVLWELHSLPVLIYSLPLLRVNVCVVQIVIFSADNGPEDVHIYFNSVGSTGPFRGRKRSIYEGGQRVPFIIRYPNVIPANTTSSVLMSSVDFLPTIASLTNTPLPEEVTKDLVGMDMSAVLKGMCD